ncbi:MAG: recombination mediator RecR [Clostridium sp.]|nr:recombination mediator RecR [Prevotella sp.]MCM1428689.1 recombination mediator RecR [Clostridium sp.]MCM1475064.1 recombination mediator RecR [Muribaculaceae bacterium]
MNDQSYNSSLLDTAVSELAKLPGIGRKTALRLALHLLRQEKSAVEALGNSLIDMRQNIQYCHVCHNISEEEVCPICSDHRRDSNIICVVENVKDVLTVEASGEFHGLYHVLGGVISPLDGIGPSDLEIDSLIERLRKGDIDEVIFALSPTIEGDTTNFYIFRKMEGMSVRTSVLARGLSVGNDLENTDELTLGRSIVNRIPFSGSYEQSK